MNRLIILYLCTSIASFGQEALLGVIAQPAEPETRRHYSRIMPDGTGLTVLRLAPASPAAELLKPGDILLEADGRQLQSTADLKTAVAAHRPGDALDLKTLRHGEIRQICITLGSRTPQVTLKGKELSEFNRLLLLLVPHGDAPVDVPAARRQMLKLSEMKLAAKDEYDSIIIHMVTDGKLIRVTSNERGISVEDAGSKSASCFLEASSYKRQDARLPETIADRLIRSAYYKP